MESCGIITYTNKNSINHDPICDLKISLDNCIIGFNKKLGHKKNFFLLIPVQDTYDLYFAGKSMGTYEKSFQPWHEHNGKIWKYIYEVECIYYLGNIDTFCQQHNFDRKIFTLSLMRGHPTPIFLPELNRASTIARQTIYE
jgi:hypothetical protein